MILALGSGWALVKVGLLLSAVLGLLMLANRRVRARAEGAGAKSVRLTAQHSLHVVEVEGKRLLVGVGPSGAPALLCELDGERASTPAPAPASSGSSAEPRVGPQVGWDGF